MESKLVLLLTVREKAMANIGFISFSMMVISMASLIVWSYFVYYEVVKWKKVAEIVWFVFGFLGVLGHFCYVIKGGMLATLASILAVGVMLTSGKLLSKEGGDSTPYEISVMLYILFSVLMLFYK